MMGRANWRAVFNRLALLLLLALVPDLALWLPRVFG